MPIEVRKNIPLPVHRSKAGRSKYPFAQMQPGDSFLFPAGTNPMAAYQAARRGREIYGKDFRTTKLDDGRFGCWLLGDLAPAEGAHRPTRRMLRDVANGKAA